MAEQQTIEDLGKKVKAKYPGVYDDIPDSEVGKKVKAKYPGAYDDFTDTPVQQVASPESWSSKLGMANVTHPLAKLGRAAVDVAEGAASGLATTAASGIKLADLAGGGPLIRKLTGTPDPMQDPRAQQIIKRATTAPDTFAGKAGRFAEQAAEFMVPGGVVGKAVRGAPLAVRAGAEGATMGAVSGVQSDFDPKTMTMGTILGALGPVLGAGVKASYRAANETLDAFLTRNPKLRSTMQTAIDYAKAHKIPLTAGQEAGNEHLITLEQQLPSQWGSSQIAQKANLLQEEALIKEAQVAANRINPTKAASPIESAENLSSRLMGRITESKNFVNKRYDQVRSILKSERNTQTRVIGQKESALVDEFGQPLKTDVTATFETPIDVTRSQKDLRPLYDEIAKLMPEAQRQNSPGFTALREIIEGKKVMDAETLDKNLGAIKALIRRAGKDFLPSRSQGIAARVVGSLEKEVTDAYGKAGGGALAKLWQARRGVKDYHEVNEILASLPDEPGALYARLVQGSDKRLNLLKDLQQYAPKEVQQVGNTFMQGLVDKLTANGQIGRAEGVLADWNRLGPETKRILFGNQEQANQFHRFLITVQELNKMRNPSGTAKAMASLSSILSVSKGAKNYALAKILMEPGGPGKVRTLLVAPEGSAAYKSAAYSVQQLIGGPKQSSVPQLEGAPQ